MSDGESESDSEIKTTTRVMCKTEKEYREYRKHLLYRDSSSDDDSFSSDGQGNSVVAKQRRKRPRPPWRPRTVVRWDGDECYANDWSNSK